METDRLLIDFADHITTVLAIEELRATSQALFEIGLPQAWPLSEQPGFATVGIRFGNLNLELCAVDRRFNKLNDWLTFEPVDLDNLANELTLRGIEHDPFDAVVIHGQPIYTRIGLPSLAEGLTALQLCHTFYPTRTTGPIAPKNQAGIKNVSTINLGMSERSKQTMGKLLLPKKLVSSVGFDEGPSLFMSSAEQLQVKGFSILVEDSVQAANALIAAGMTRLDACSVQIGSLKIEIIDKRSPSSKDLSVETDSGL